MKNISDFSGFFRAGGGPAQLPQGSTIVGKTNYEPPFASNMVQEQIQGTVRKVPNCIGTHLNLKKNACNTRAIRVSNIFATKAKKQFFKSKNLNYCTLLNRVNEKHGDKRGHSVYLYLRIFQLKNKLSCGAEIFCRG